MKESVKKLWLQELREGNRRQASGVLHATEDSEGVKGDAFCCLGVLCEVAVREGAIPAPGPDDVDEDGNVEYGKRVKSATGLPLAVQRWAGIYSELGNFSRNPQSSHRYVDAYVENEDGEFVEVSHYCLSEMNDSGVKFDQIADVIEREF